METFKNKANEYLSESGATRRTVNVVAVKMEQAIAAMNDGDTDLARDLISKAKADLRFGA